MSNYKTPRDRDGLTKADREVLARGCWGSEAQRLYDEERRIEEWHNNPYFTDENGRVCSKADYSLSYRYPNDWHRPEFREAWVNGSLFKDQNDPPKTLIIPDNRPNARYSPIERAEKLQELQFKRYEKYLSLQQEDFESLLKKGSLLTVLQLGLRKEKVPDIGVSFFTNPAVKSFLSARGNENNFPFNELRDECENHQPQFTRGGYSLTGFDEHTRNDIIQAACRICLYAMALKSPDLEDYNRFNIKSGRHNFAKCIKVLDQQKFPLQELSETLANSILLHAPFGTGEALSKTDLEVVLTHPRVVPLPVEAREKVFRVLLKDTVSVSEAMKLRKLFLPEMPDLAGYELAKAIVQDAREKWSQTEKDASTSFSIAMNAFHDVTSAVDQRRAQHYSHLAASQLFNLASSADEMLQVTKATGVRPDHDQMFEILERSAHNIVEQTYLKYKHPCVVPL